MSELTFAIAFLAGILSFFSPCVFALVPAFLAYLAGINLKSLDSSAKFNRVIFLNTLCYVLGFTLVFALLGMILNSALNGAGIALRHWLTRVGAIIIIVFGVYLLGFIRIPWLDTEHKVHIRRKAGYLTSFLFGMTFAIGWTPCIGAVLGGIFTLAATQPGSSFSLLLAYSFGLALPFLIVGVFYSSIARYVRIGAKYTRMVSIILGILLIIVGILLLTNRFSLFGIAPLFGSAFL